MKRLITAAVLFTCMSVNAQSTSDPAQTGKLFMKQGDYANAILVLNRAVDQDPQNINAAKDLALSYHYLNDNHAALAVIQKVIENPAADDQAYQIAGNIYKGLNQLKECEKLFKKGIKRFPKSGPLYNELGELLLTQKDHDAIKTWERGIEYDPSYSRNYFNASRYYFFNNDVARSLLYSELFLNIEPAGPHTAEMKQLLYDGYKKFYSTSAIPDTKKEKSDFIKQFTRILNNQTALTTSGITTASLSMIRTRFILEWFAANNNKMPFKLFEYQRQLLKDGMFDAYNQWLFGPAENLAAYKNWTDNHSAEYKAFDQLQRSRMFKPVTGEYYSRK